MTGHFVKKYRQKRKTRNFYNEKVPSDSQRTYNESEKKKELKMTGHFYNEKDRRT